MSANRSSMDLPLFGAIMLMLGFGIVLVYSSSFAIAQHKYGGSDFYLMRQGMRALIAVVFFMVCINVDYHVWGRMSGVFLVVAVIMLAGVLFLPDSQAINGARRWLSIGPVQFQVSDFARMALILFIARKCDQVGAEIKNGAVFVRQLVAVGAICILILLEPNFSTSAIIGIVALAMLFLSGARFWHIMGLVLAAIPIAALLVLRTSYRRARLVGFLDMSNRKSDIGYQAYQSLVGLGNGGLAGVGLGKGEQKFFYLPEPHTDFILSILGEEAGFIGILVVISVLVFIVYRGMRIALNAPDRMGQIMAFGFTFTVALYAIMHACVASGLVPTTGLPMPFLSYGGMSLIFTMCSMGIILNISTRSSRIMTPEGKL